MNFWNLDLNDKLKNTLSDALGSGKVPHTIVIEGSNSDRRIKLARLLAGALLCEAKAGRPCMLCRACGKSFGAARAGKKINVDKLLNSPLKHADAIEVEKDKNRAQFSVEIVRGLIAESYIVPNEAEAKVYIIREAHLMSLSAQNAFLKLLEEPPAYVLFILECTNAGLLLPTVLSRSVVFNLGLLDLSDGMRAKKASLVEEIAADMAMACTKKDDFELLKAVAVFEKEKQLIPLALAAFIELMREALVIKCGVNVSESDSDIGKKLAGAFSSKALADMAGVAQELSETTDRNANNNLLITRICAGLRQAAGH